MYDFPSSPTIGQVFGSYTWDGQKWTQTPVGCAPLNSPAFTGTPTAPTPTAGDNSTKIMTTAFSAANALRADIVQTLTAAQQAQGRSNIYAAPFDALAYNGMQFNGAMEITQEKGTANTTVSGQYICDGWVLLATGSMAINAGAAVAGGPVGIPALVFLSVVTPEVSLGAGDFAALYQNIEGNRAARLAWGTANAQPLTIGFWTSHTPAGAYSVAVNAADASYSYVVAYTQNVAAAWQYNTVTIPGPQVGTWFSDSRICISLKFTMAAGSSYTAPTANTWNAGNFIAAPGQTNGVATANNALRVTGVVLLPGIEAPTAARAPFIMRPFGQELLTCKRYWQFLGAASGQFYAAAACQMFCAFTPMRAAPTLVIMAGSTALSSPATANYNIASIAAGLGGLEGGSFNLNTSGNAATPGASVWLANAASLALNARL